MTKFYEEEAYYKMDPWYPEPGDLLVHSDLTNFKSDFGWYPGNPCYMGRFLLVLECNTETFIYFDIDKCGVFESENFSMLPWYKVMQ